MFYFSFLKVRKIMVQIAMVQIALHSSSVSQAFQCLSANHSQTDSVYIIGYLWEAEFSFQKGIQLMVGPERNFSFFLDIYFEIIHSFFFFLNEAVLFLSFV